MMKELKAAWKALPTAEKWKMGISMVCEVGADILTTVAVGRILPKDTKRWKKLAVGVAAGGIGMHLGAVAEQQYCHLIDVATGSASMFGNAVPKEAENGGRE